MALLQRRLLPLTRFFQPTLQSKRRGGKLLEEIGCFECQTESDWEWNVVWSIDHMLIKSRFECIGPNLLFSRYRKSKSTSHELYAYCLTKSMVIEPLETAKFGTRLGEYNQRAAQS